MNLVQKFFTESDCYKQSKKMIPSGIMVHSTATPGVKNDRWFSAWNKSGIDKAVHAFIDETGVMQALPWDCIGWHSGVGSKGKSQNANNNGYIGFEICEPAGHTYNGGQMVNYDAASNEEYFNSVYNSAVELCAFLAEKYSIPVEKIICHSEGYSMGIASNHSDVMQWFPKHGKSMDTFRQDVKNMLGVKTVRKFRLLEEMNFRKSPNGTKICVIPANTVVSGDTMQENNGILWLYTVYNGSYGFVAVLPENKKYATEIKDNPEDDYFKNEYYSLKEKIEKIREIVKN